MNLYEHFTLHPELINCETVAKIRKELPQAGKPTKENFSKLKELANLCHVPNAYRSNYKNLHDLIDRICVRLAWALEIQQKGLEAGDTVKINSNKKIDVITAIATDYSIRLRDSKGAFNPKHLSKVKD